jgi:hypothetical protein
MKALLLYDDQYEKLKSYIRHNSGSGGFQGFLKKLRDARVDHNLVVNEMARMQDQDDLQASLRKKP